MPKLPLPCRPTTRSNSHLTPGRMSSGTVWISTDHTTGLSPAIRLARLAFHEIAGHAEITVPAVIELPAEDIPVSGREVREPALHGHDLVIPAFHAVGTAPQGRAEVFARLPGHEVRDALGVLHNVPQRVRLAEDGQGAESGAGDADAVVVRPRVGVVARHLLPLELAETQFPRAPLDFIDTAQPERLVPRVVAQVERDGQALQSRAVVDVLHDVCALAPGRVTEEGLIDNLECPAPRIFASPVMTYANP